MENIESVLNELYALRAGLSAISLEHDKVKTIEEEADEQFIKAAKQLGGVTEFVNFAKNCENFDRYNIGKTCDNYDDNLLLYGKWLATDKSREYYSDVYKSAEKEKATGNDFNGHQQKKFFGLFLGLLALSLVMFIGAAFIVFFGADLLSHSFGQFIGIFAGGIALGIGALIVFIGSITCAKAWREYKECFNREKQRSTGRYSTYSNLYNGYEAAHSISANALRDKNAKISPIKESCNEFYFALRKQFSQLLDERDWKNLDLVIYELETRRADNMKEALQLVDRELQTERIQNTIILATEQISYEIRRGFTEIKKTIVECSRVISTQLAGITLQLDGVSAQLGELTDAVNLGNALQAKANTNISQIMSDVSYVRYYAI